MMRTEMLNQKMQKAQEYAASARDRNIQDCMCQNCIRLRDEERMVRLINNWGMS